MSDSIQQDPPILDVEPKFISREPPQLEPPALEPPGLGGPASAKLEPRKPHIKQCKSGLLVESEPELEPESASEPEEEDELRLAPLENSSRAATSEAAQYAVDEPNKNGAKAKPIRTRPWYRWPFWLLGRSWDLTCLWILLAVVAAIPVVQLASLGYILTAAANLARGERLRESLPGRRVAGKLGTFVMLASLFWLPVWLVGDMSYSAQLLRPSSGVANAWRFAAFAVTGLWVAHISWAAIRGGRWWHFLWPAPIRFAKQIWRPSTWARTSDALYELVSSWHFSRLWWLGARASLAALLWITIPVSLMIVGQRAYDLEPAGLVGFSGAAAMTLIMLYLPFLQIQIAVENRFSAILKLRTIRRRFCYAPWAFALSLLGLCLLCIPLYLLRIEATPAELLWAPSMVFVLFMLPAKLMLGAAMGYAAGRETRGLKVRHWTLRWPARVIALASVLIYVGALYVAQLVAGQGALVMYFQHAFLVPAPLISS